MSASYTTRLLTRIRGLLLNLFAAILHRIERLALPPPVVDGSAL